MPAGYERLLRWDQAMGGPRSGSGSKGAVPMERAWPVTCAGRAEPSSKSTAPTARSGTLAAHPTPSMPNRRHGPCSREKRNRSPKPMRTGSA